MGSVGDIRGSKEFLGDDELQDILNRIKARYKTELVPIGIRSAQLKILAVKDIDALIDQAVTKSGTGDVRFKYWGKIWEASIVLASFIGEQDLMSGASVLELGAGTGVTGLFMAAWGNRVLLTDNSEDALLFARANIYLNDLQSNADVKLLDWTNPDLDRQFDYIVGSEIVHDENMFPHLLDLFIKYLKPSGTIFLAEAVKSNQSSFFEMLVKYFRYERRGLVMRSGDEQYRVSIYRAWPR
ncbi:MAG TPA: methyltransferase domain-containing protein [Deltaproteobacteria bacterium]|nr:methyltransferase domain-containing protein [Deltaproteobacteria bacterium]